MDQNKNTGASQRLNKPLIIGTIVAVGILVVILVFIQSIKKNGNTPARTSYKEAKNEFQSLVNVVVGDANTKKDDDLIPTDISNYESWLFYDKVASKSDATSDKKAYSDKVLDALEQYYKKIKTINSQDSQAVALRSSIRALIDYYLYPVQENQLADTYVSEGKDSAIDIVNNRETAKDADPVITSAVTDLLNNRIEYLDELTAARCIRNNAVVPQCISRNKFSALDKYSKLNTKAELAYREVLVKTKDYLVSVNSGLEQENANK